MNTALLRSTATLLINGVSAARGDFFRTGLQAATVLLPHGIRSGLGSIAARLNGSRLPTSKAALLLLAGSKTDLGTHLEARVGAGSSAQRRRLAEVAIVAAKPAMAESLLQGDQDGKTAQTRARLYLYNGRPSDAIAALDGRTDAASRRLQEKILAEREVLTDFVPQLKPVPAYEGNENVVLHVLTNSVPFTASGYTSRTHSLLSRQAGRGLRVHAVTRIGYPAVVGKLAREDVSIIDGVHYHRLLPWRLPRLATERIQRQAEELLKIAVTVKPSVLHTTTDYTNALVTRAVAQALGIPWVYEVRGFLADTWASSRGAQARDSERYRLFSEREREATRSADAVLTLGVAMRERLTGAPSDSREVTVVSNGVSLRELDAARGTHRIDAGSPDSTVTIGTVSSFVPYEGLTELIDAFAALHQEDPAVRLKLFGDGSEFQALAERVATHGLGAAIDMPGRVSRSEALAAHWKLDVFAVPRIRSEVTELVTPLKAVEAIAAGSVTVLRDLPALRELRAGFEDQTLLVGDGVQSLLDGLRSAVARAREKGRTIPPDRDRLDWNHKVATISETYGRLTAHASK